MGIDNLEQQIAKQEERLKQLKAQLNQYLTENRDRQLFDLPLLEEKKNETAL